MFCEMSQTVTVLDLRSVNSSCNKNSSNENSVLSAEVPQPFTLVSLSFLLENAIGVKKSRLL